MSSAAIAWITAGGIAFLPVRWFRFQAARCRVSGIGPGVVVGNDVRIAGRERAMSRGECDANVQKCVDRERSLPAAAGFPGTRSKHILVCSHAVSRCVTVPEIASSRQAPFTDNQIALFAIRGRDSCIGRQGRHAPILTIRSRDDRPPHPSCGAVT